MRIIDILINEERVRTSSLIISAIGLILSLAGIKIGVFDFAWIAIIFCGLPMLKNAGIGLVTRFDIKASVLVSIALIASVFMGELFAAGEVAFIMILGGLLENVTIAKSRAGIEKLIKLTPQTARIVTDSGENVIAAKEVKIGDLIKILPGETIPIDGIIIEGETSIDQSVMTGESVPVDKTIDDEVQSGTMNQFGSIIIKATKLGEDSSLQKMIELVKSSDSGQSEIVRTADRWATWLVVIALSSAILVYLLTGELIRAVTVLVVFCPCALVLATPTAIMAAVGNLTKYGILVKEGSAIEKLAKVNKITFDKTGTLTYGKPELTNIIPYKNIEENNLLKIIASLENKSEHPLGKAIVQYYQKKENKDFYPVDNFKMIIGKGVKGEIDNKLILAGNTNLLEENNVKIPSNWIDEYITSFFDRGSTIIFVSINNEFSGAVILNDEIRKNAKEIVKSLSNRNIGSILLTGDNQKPAEYIAKETGIDEIYYNCLPDEKMEIINKYQNNNIKVSMIGDGVNDALSLKKSYVGIAMGGIGSDIAIEASDISLVSDDIQYIPHLFGLAKKTMQTINVNIIISLIINFLAIILSFYGILTPITGALVHNISSVFVVVYSALLIMWK